MYLINKEDIKMDFKIIRELKKVENNKKCGILTCVHYAGGFCVGCENEEECEFTEMTITQD
jgi:hypothetical protein